MLSLDFEKGGLKIINIENQQKMFLTKWSAKLIQEKDTFWAQIIKQLFKPLVNIHSTLNATVPPNYNQAINKIDSHFWREAIKATTTMNKNRNPESIKTEPI